MNVFSQTFVSAFGPGAYQFSIFLIIFLIFSGIISVFIFLSVFKGPHEIFKPFSIFLVFSHKLLVPLSHEEILSFHHSFLHCLTPFLFPECAFLLILVDSILISLYFIFFALILYLLSALVSGNPLHFILYLSCPSLCFFFGFPFNQDINIPKVFL